MRSGSNYSYDQNLSRLFSRRFGWSDVWKFSLEPLGYVVEEIILNSPHLQHAWAKENGTTFSQTEWKTEIVCAQLKKLQPEILFLDDYGAFRATQVRRIRQSAPSIRLIVGWCGAPYLPDAPFKEFDLILSNIPSLAGELRSKGCKSSVLKHAFDERIFPQSPPLAVTKKRLTFCGSVSIKKGWHERRAAYLDRLAGAVPMRIASDLYRQIGRLRGRIARIGSRLVGKQTDRSSIEQLLCSRLNLPGLNLAASLTSPLAGLDMYSFLESSTATFNMHIGKSSGEASNMRLFEATGVGACLLTDSCEDLQQLFEPDSEVLAYSTADECVEKACWLMDNPEKARQIGLRARAKTLAKHTFQHRAPEFDAILQKQLKKNSTLR